MHSPLDEHRYKFMHGPTRYILNKYKHTSTYTLITNIFNIIERVKFFNCTVTRPNRSFLYECLFLKQDQNLDLCVFNFAFGARDLNEQIVDGIAQY